jgi:hypothetical protein
MIEPTYSDTMEVLYDKIPSVYRDEDEKSGEYVLKRWLSGVVDQAGDVEDFLNRADITTPDDGGDPNDKSDLIDPVAADEAWLPWIGQMLGKKLQPSMSTVAKRSFLANAGYTTGTKQAIAAAAATELVGTKSVTIYDHTTDVSAIGAGGQWDVLIVTKASEKLENLAPEQMATTSSTNYFEQSAELTATIQEHTTLGLYMDRVIRFTATGTNAAAFFATDDDTPGTLGIPVTPGDTNIAFLSVIGSKNVAATLQAQFYTAAGAVVSAVTSAVNITTGLQQFSISFTVPATTAYMRIGLIGVSIIAGDWFELAQIGVRRGAINTWVPRTADPIAAVIKAGAKPAGIKLWTKNAEATWDAIFAANPTWAVWDTKTWTQIEETGL